MRETVRRGPRPFAEAVRKLEKPGLMAALRNAGMTTKAFMDLFPELLLRDGRSVRKARKAIAE